MIVWASDGISTAEDAFFWTVTATALTNPGDQVSAAGSAVSLALQAQDPRRRRAVLHCLGPAAGVEHQRLHGSHLWHAAADRGGFLHGQRHGGRPAQQRQPDLFVDGHQWQREITNPGNQTTAEGSNVMLPIPASDPQQAPLSFDATGLPPGLVIDPSSGSIAGTVPYGSLGTYSVTILVTGGSGRNASVKFIWTISSVTTAPTLANPGTQTNFQGDDVSLQLVASNANPGNLTFSVSGLPAGLTINPYTGLIYGTIDDTAALGNLPVTATVTNGTLTASVNFVWNVEAANVPPGINTIDNQTWREGDRVSVRRASTAMTTP